MAVQNRKRHRLFGKSGDEGIDGIIKRRQIRA